MYEKSSAISKLDRGPKYDILKSLDKKDSGHGQHQHMLWLFFYTHLVISRQSIYKSLFCKP